MIAAGAAGQQSAQTSEWDCHDCFFGFPEARELRAGVLDEDAEHVFTNGHCHSFAEAICRLTTAAELVFAYEHDGAGGEVQGHVLVRITGRYLDARGWVDVRLRSEEPNRAFEGEWDQVLRIAPNGWLANSTGWRRPRVDDALPFAAALLRHLEVPIDRGPDALTGARTRRQGGET